MPGKPSSSLSCPDPAASPSRCTWRLSLAGARAAHSGTRLSSAEVPAFICNTEPFASVVVVVSSARWDWDIGRVGWRSCRSPWGMERSTADIFIFSVISKSLGLVALDTSPAPFWGKQCLGELCSLEVWGRASPHTWPHTGRPIPELRTCSQSAPISHARHHGSHWRDSLPAP